MESTASCFQIGNAGACTLACPQLLDALFIAKLRRLAASTLRGFPRCTIGGLSFARVRGRIRSPLRRRSIGFDAIDFCNDAIENGHSGARTDGDADTLGRVIAPFSRKMRGNRISTMVIPSARRGSASPCAAGSDAEAPDEARKALIPEQKAFLENYKTLLKSKYAPASVGRETIGHRSCPRPTMT